MPLKAMIKGTGKTIYSFDKEAAGFKKGELVCQYCEAPVSFVNLHMREGSAVKPHFRHLVVCASDVARHPESPLHLTAKETMMQYLPQWSSEYANATVEPEVRVQLETGLREADLVVYLPGGWRHVHEVQLSPITVEELEDRTNHYEQAGFDAIFWWFGPDAATFEAVQWHRKRTGTVCKINIRDKQVSIPLPIAS